LDAPTSEEAAMVFKLLHDWLAVEMFPNDLSHRGRVVMAGPNIDECGEGDVILVNPEVGYDTSLNGRVHRIIDRQGIVGVVDFDDELDDDMRPASPQLVDEDEEVEGAADA
jgi:hypothetical protein